MRILIIGSEETMQRDLRRNIEDIIHELKLECQLEVIHDIEEIIEIEGRQLLLTPALIIEDKIVVQGHSWPKEHLKEYINTHFINPVESEPKESSVLPDKFATWKGVPRGEIDWHPSIDEEKCTG